MNVLLLLLKCRLADLLTSSVAAAEGFFSLQQQQQQIPSVPPRYALSFAFLLKGRNAEITLPQRNNIP